MINEGTESPLFLYQMIKEKAFKSEVNNWLDEQNMFLVNLHFSASNKITIEIDSEKGAQVGDCTRLNKHLRRTYEEALDAYALEVATPGLDQPIRMPQQYHKHLGRDLEVQNREGEKVKGTLKQVEDTGIELEVSSGKKDKTMMSIPFEQVEEARVVLKW